MKQDLTKSFNMDCMEGMKQYPDGWFDLAVVDPEYGIGRDGSLKTTSKHGGRKAHTGKKKSDWAMKRCEITHMDRTTVDGKHQGTLPLSWAPTAAPPTHAA